MRRIYSLWPGYIDTGNYGARVSYSSGSKKTGAVSVYRHSGIEHMPPNENGPRSLRMLVREAPGMLTVCVGARLHSRIR